LEDRDTYTGYNLKATKDANKLEPITFEFLKLVPSEQVNATWPPVKRFFMKFLKYRLAADYK
jgi:hypothetical protein